MPPVTSTPTRPGEQTSQQHGPQNAAPAPPSKAARRRRLIVEYVIIAAVAVGLALLVQAYIVKPYRIPSPSMENTLKNGDRVFVNRFIYHFRSVHRGDIVVFREPKDGPEPGTVLIKRVIGLPGDTISSKVVGQAIVDGTPTELYRIFVNGHELNEPYVMRYPGTSIAEVSAPFDNGLAWSLAQPYKVPPHEYFMMGDNRTDSEDSRAFGPVPQGNIIGEAFFIYWPLNRIRVL
jgi:signal peptidase I